LIRTRVSRIGASHLREVLVADNPAYRVWPRYFDPHGAGAAHSSIRASDADRERLVEVLKDGFAEGRLTQDEYNFRLERAYAARTYGELGALVADLPGGAPFGPAYAFPAYRRPRTNAMAIASLSFGIAEFFTMGLTAIPAITFGYIARRQMRETGEQGYGMAKAGLILGWTAVALSALMVILTVIVGLALTRSAHTVTIHPGPIGPQLMPYFRGPGTGG
jgi:hypothetical protein